MAEKVWLFHLSSGQILQFNTGNNGLCRASWLWHCKDARYMLWDVSFGTKPRSAWVQNAFQWL